MNITKQTVALSVLLAAALLTVAANAGAGEVLEIKVNRPLRDPAITRDPASGLYYLTGTAGTPTPDGTADFDRNAGVFLWKSKDLATWEEVGLAWGYQDAHGPMLLRWVTQLQPVHNRPGRPGERLGHALAAAELHAVKGKWVITFSKNHWHSGLLAADSPTGPFRFIDGYPWDSKPPARRPYSGAVSPHSFMMAGDPSLFTDADGAVYMVWGPGWIVKLNETLDRWAEEPKALQTAIDGWPNVALPFEMFGEDGACVFRKDGRYYFVFAATVERDGKRQADTLMCSSDKLWGPYTKPAMLIPGGGQAKFFEDGKEMRASCMRDGKPVIVTVELK